MASPSSSSSQPRPPPPPPLVRRPRFRSFTTQIPDRRPEEEDEGSKTQQRRREGRPEEPSTAASYEHRPTPLHPASPPAASGGAAAADPKRTRAAGGTGAVNHVVSFNKCRPSTRENISVVPLDVARGGGGGGAGRGRSRTFSSDASPGNNGVVKSLFSALIWRSPRPYPVAVAEEEWRLAATELSRRLIHATRKRDDAMAEASRLKYSAERKLAGLESYCRDLKSRLDHFAGGNHRRLVGATAPAGSGEFPLEPFLRAVSDSRSAVQHLSRSLAAQMSQDGDDHPPKARGRLLHLIQQEDGGGGGGLLFYLEALLSRVFYEDFELAGFHRHGSDGVLDPRARAKANTAAYAALRGLSWDDVLGRGTRHYNEGFSQFCDRKMGEVAASTAAPGGGGGWRGAWPEPLLRAFFEASKGVWLVHLLARSAHPPVPIFRVDKGAPFDGGYMEAAVAAGKGRPAAVRMMLAPGFYVMGGVVKCRVLCTHGGGGEGDEIGRAAVRVHHHGRSDRSRNGTGRHQKG